MFSRHGELQAKQSSGGARLLDRFAAPLLATTAHLWVEHEVLA
jgi:hypothetical protein